MEKKPKGAKPGRKSGAKKTEAVLAKKISEQVSDTKKEIDQSGRETDVGGEDKKEDDTEVGKSSASGDPLQSYANAGDRNEAKDDAHSLDTVDGRNKNNLAFATFGIVVAVLACTCSYFFLPESTLMHIDVQSKLDQLFQDFKNQSPRSAKKLSSRVLPYLNHSRSPQPFVLLIAAMHEDQQTADCFASRVGKLIRSNPVVINGSLYSNVSSDEVKLEIDEKLREAFQQGDFPTAAVIHNLDSLPYSTSQLFYAYCDHDNPRYKEATIIFTVTLPQTYDTRLSDSDDIKREEIVGTYLQEDSQWAKDEKFDENIMGALLSRISDTVIIMSRESQESLEKLCKTE